ncbi:MAG: calcium/sodium antiporter [Anaerolineales bacterium]|nr:calcium/sodium antiporter [Anaerolineales bacterium]MBX3036268.1 calcium/sodium antiporter [Anaerolineales bacterium]
MTYLLFIVGLITLIIGAEILVRGASRLAAIFGVSPLVIGLTIVAFGTSSPELAVSVQSALAGQADISIGNVIGSNVFNIFFILGIAALIRPIKIAEQLIKLDSPIMVGVSIFALVLALDGWLSRLEGIILISLLIAYIVFTLWASKKEGQGIQDEYAEEYTSKETKGWKSLAKNSFFVVAGLAMLYYGSNWLVEAAVIIARTFGVSELVIGLTIVAAGTSMPEVATSVVAAFKGEGDISAGNVIGSNIFNILGVFGVAAATTPESIPVAAHVVTFDLPIAIFAAVVTLPVFVVDNYISRFDGLIFFSYFVFYNLYIVLRAVNNPSVSILETFLMAYIPLTFFFFIAVAARYLWQRRKNASP